MLDGECTIRTLPYPNQTLLKDHLSITCLIYLVPLRTSQDYLTASVPSRSLTTLGADRTLISAKDVNRT